MIISLALIIGALSVTPVSGNAQAEQPVDQYGRASNRAATVRLAPAVRDVALSEVEGRSAAGTRSAGEAAPVRLAGRSVGVFGRT
jgi:hypothetical protein